MASASSDAQADLYAPCIIAANYIALAFVEQFYTLFDQNRSDLPSLFTENAQVVWDGHTGKPILEQLPLTTHKKLCVDAQPIKLPYEQVPIGAPAQVLVSVQGDVTYGPHKKERGFHHQFILTLIGREQPSRYQIQSFICRLQEATLSYGEPHQQQQQQQQHQQPHHHNNTQQQHHHSQQQDQNRHHKPRYQGGGGRYTGGR